jgi:hypothetical protein
VELQLKAMEDRNKQELEEAAAEGVDIDKILAKVRLDGSHEYENDPLLSDDYQDLLPPELRDDGDDVRTRIAQVLENRDRLSSDNSEPS